MFASILTLESSKKDILFSFLQVIGASLFLALCSKISIPLYFTPVPITGSTFAVMLIGATLGSRKGLLSVLAYLIEGGLGLPFISIHLLGLFGGYYLGFLFQAYLVGWFIERQSSFQVSKVLSVLLFSCAIQLGFGVLWLSSFVGAEFALTMGLYPFLLGELIKAISITIYLKQRHKKVFC